jgi:hypothetical protein
MSEVLRDLPGGKEVSILLKSLKITAEKRREEEIIAEG